LGQGGFLTTLEKGRGEQGLTDCFRQPPEAGRGSGRDWGGGAPLFLDGGGGISHHKAPNGRFRLKLFPGGLRGRGRAK